MGISDEKIKMQMKGGPKNRATPSRRQRTSPQVPAGKTDPADQKKESVAQGVGKQRTYWYSEDALKVLEAAKKNEHHRLDKFVSDAIIEHGKRTLKSENFPLKTRAGDIGSENSVSTDKRLSVLESVVASLGVQLLKREFKDAFDDIVKYAHEKEFDPYRGSFSAKCKKCSRDTSLLAEKYKKPLWWALFYALKKNILSVKAS